MTASQLIPVVNAMRSFQREIPVMGPVNPDALLREVFEKCPALLYFVKGLSVVSGFRTARLRVDYYHTEYPIERISTPSRDGLEDLLRRTVMNYEPLLVLVVPHSLDFNWIFECFWTRSISFYPNTKAYESVYYQFSGVPYSVYELRFSYRIGRPMLRTMELEVSGKVSRLQRELFPIPMPDSAKCLIAHNYLATTVEYRKAKEGNPLESGYVQSAYGALIKGVSVCQGYSEAYKRILDAAGVPCDLVTGKVLEDDEWHAWNIVHLNHNRIHCHVDVTWDSNMKKSRSTYLLKGDRLFSGKRTWPQFFFPACQDGTELVSEAVAFCSGNRRTLLGSGLRPEWIELGRSF